MKHYYYIEICVEGFDSDPNYALQSRFFESESEAVNWFNINFDYVNEYMLVYLMRTNNEKFDNYNELEDYDIIQVRRIK